MRLYLFIIYFNFGGCSTEFCLASREVPENFVISKFVIFFLELLQSRRVRTRAVPSPRVALAVRLVCNLKRNVGIRMKKIEHLMKI